MRPHRVYSLAEYAALPNCRLCGRRLIYSHAWNCPRNPQPKPNPVAREALAMLTGHLPIYPDRPDPNP